MCYYERVMRVSVFCSYRCSPAIAAHHSPEGAAVVGRIFPARVPVVPAWAFKGLIFALSPQTTSEIRNGKEGDKFAPFAVAISVCVALVNSKGRCMAAFQDAPGSNYLAELNARILTFRPSPARTSAPNTSLMKIEP